MPPKSQVIMYMQKVEDLSKLGVGIQKDVPKESELVVVLIAEHGAIIKHLLCGVKEKRSPNQDLECEKDITELLFENACDKLKLEYMQKTQIALDRNILPEEKDKQKYAALYLFRKDEKDKVFSINF